jgi:hypothetical protein
MKFNVLIYMKSALYHKDLHYYIMLLFCEIQYVYLQSPSHPALPSSYSSSSCPSTLPFRSIANASGLVFERGTLRVSARTTNTLTDVSMVLVHIKPSAVPLISFPNHYSLICNHSMPLQHQLLIVAK